MLDFEIIPEFALGNADCKFLLGMLFNQAVYFIQDNCLNIKAVQILYSDLAPLSMDLVVNMSEDGVRLIFDSYTQRLKLIEIYNLQKIKLKYSGKYFCTTEIKPTLEKIDNVFGPTLPGIYDPNQQLFVLNFRGLSFSFPIESHFQPNYSNGMGSLQFLEGQTPIVSKICIYSGDDFDNMKCPPISPISFEGGSYLEKIDVLIKQDNNTAYGLKIVYSTEAFDPISTTSHSNEKITFERHIYLDDPSQNIHSSLGQADKIFYKGEDKMEIHKQTTSNLQAHCYNPYSASVYTDYFYNYFDLGLDILFDGEHNRVKKFILHTNYPGHYDFNIYNRAHFDVPLNLTADQNISQPLITTSDDKSFSNDRDKSVTDGIFHIDPFSKWDEIKEFFSRKSSNDPSRRTDEIPDKPVVLNRTSSVNSVNPFGSTYCYAFKNIIFEIMPNNHISTVTIFCPTTT